MAILPIARPGPFKDYSTNTFVEEPSVAQDYIDPINAAHFESENWKWRYFEKAQRYNFTYGEEPESEFEVSQYKTFENVGVDFISNDVQMSDDDSVSFLTGWSYIANQPFEWNLRYRCENNGTLGLHSCFARYSYPGATLEDGQVNVYDVDNGETNLIDREVTIVLPATNIPRPVTMNIYANVGEDIGAGAEIQYVWRFGPIGTFVS